MLEATSVRGGNMFLGQSPPPASLGPNIAQLPPLTGCEIYHSEYLLDTRKVKGKYPLDSLDILRA